MKPRNDAGMSLNPLNVILQSLYHLCPLRDAVFRKFQFPSQSPLELIFAKIHYDFEGRNGGSTDASVYFNDSFLSEPLYDHGDPNLFFYWIFKGLIELEEFRKMIQWELLSIKRTISTNSEVSIEDHYEIITVNRINTKTTTSLQSYVREELFASKSEQVTITSNGIATEKTIENYVELVNEPTIAAFKLPRSIDSGEEFEFPLLFTVEPVLTLPSGKIYNLAVVILYNPEDLTTFSTCLKGNQSSIQGSPDWWYRLQDDSIQKVSQEQVLDSASKFGYMAFYLESSEVTDSNFCDSPKPSQQLIMECLTKNTMHSISKTIKRQTSTTNSPPAILRPTNIPIKSKSVSFGTQMDDSSLNLNVDGDDSPAPISSLPTWPSKSPSPIEMSQLQHILVPEDLSNAKMRLITSGSFSQLVDLDDKPSGIGNLEISNQDMELDYFEESEPQTKSIWKSAYLGDLGENPLKVQPQPQKAHLLSEFWDFEADWPDQEHSPAAHQEFDSKMVEDVAAELFLKASLARIRKTKTTSNPVKKLFETGNTEESILSDFGGIERDRRSSKQSVKKTGSK